MRKGFRDRARSRGQNPDSIAYIRSAVDVEIFRHRHDALAGEPELIPFVLPAKPDRYDFEEHYDGEIFMSTMWDIREMLNRVYPDKTVYKRPQPKDGLAAKKITKGTEIFERDFLGAMYILGTTAPDTFVKARDAMIVADQMLYPTDSTDLDVARQTSRGDRTDLCGERTRRQREGSRRGGQGDDLDAGHAVRRRTGRAGVPANVSVESASPRSLRISWDGVPGAVAYEVLKRKIGFENRRVPNGKREYADGDASTTGFRHVAYVAGNTLSYVDKGPIHEIFAPEGLNDLFDSEYVVRAIGVNATGQIGVSNFSGSSRAITADAGFDRRRSIRRSRTSRSRTA